MAQAKKKYMDVDVIAFLEKIMKDNTKQYQSDFEIDKEIIFKCAKSERKEDKTLLWMSRSMGTQCNKEHDVFVRDSVGHNTWLYFGAQEYAKNAVFVCAVEITGETNGVVQGNVFVLDFEKLVDDVKNQSVFPLEYEKTFEDGFVLRVPMQRSSMGFYRDYVAEHGAIVDSLAIPQDEYRLHQVLSMQKRERDKFSLGLTDGHKIGLSDQIKSASASKGAKKETTPPSKALSFEYGI